MRSNPDPDDFERQLARQPLRHLPTAWREEILNAAAELGWQEMSSPEPTRAGSNRSWLYELLWPCPQAWAGLAAVWFVVLVLNSTQDGSAEVANLKSVQSSSSVLVALREQRRLLAELIGPAAPAEPAFVPRPRGQRQSGLVAV
jgi:hypothetical protein